MKKFSIVILIGFICGLLSFDRLADAYQSESVSPSCGDGIVDENEECDDGNTDNDDGCTTGCVLNMAGDLTFVNPDINFNYLTVGQTIILNAPDPTAGVVTDTAEAEVAPKNCNCTWSQSPERGTFSDEASCSTEFTPEMFGKGQLFVTVDCNAEGFGNYFQLIRVQENSDIITGGCALVGQ